MDEQELIRRAQAGDQQAFEGLMRLYQRRVMGLIRSFVRNADDAQDVFQDVFLRVWLGLARFRLESSFYTWLYRITVNRCLTWHDQRGRRENLHATPLESMDDDEDWLERTIHLQGVREESDWPLGKAELLRKIWHAVETLNPKQRLIFCLRYQHGLQVKEISEVFDMPDGTVKILAFRAIRQIRAKLKDQLE
ncbi:MAG: sigma-70 family RNA polymerase sigma factor [Candidatus Delongbacteria bacterium]